MSSTAHIASLKLPTSLRGVAQVVSGGAHVVGWPVLPLGTEASEEAGTTGPARALSWRLGSRPPAPGDAMSGQRSCQGPAKGATCTRGSGLTFPHLSAWAAVDNRALFKLDEWALEGRARA